ncbi:MAG: catalase-related domain-containing protein, partial [Ruthenibacterium sp.]
DTNYGGTVAYTPNGYGEWTAQPDVMEPPLDVEGAAWHYDPKNDPTDDNFKQGGELYRLMNETQKAALIDNTARNIESVDEKIKYRHAAHCLLADKEYGERFVAAAGLDLKRATEYSTLTNAALLEATRLD